MKKLFKLILGVLILYFLVRLCTGGLGSVLTLPGTGGGDNSGGWFSPNETSSVEGKSIEDLSHDLEKELGIGTSSGSGSKINIPSTTSTTAPSSQGSVATSSTPLAFKGIPITGSLSEFGTALVGAGFRSNGDGTYTGDFAGYNSCRITPSGNNPVREVRVDFPVTTNWDVLEQSYDSIQASLTEKYSVQPSTLPGSNLATYNLPNGTISLDADVKEQSSWHVILRYTSAATTTVPTGRNPIDDL